MSSRTRLRGLRRAWLALMAALALACAALVASTGAAQAATELPCDIYASYGTPCVAAHSTTRALYAAYDGPLYQVKRASDSTTTDIYPLAAGGYANAAAQDSFCASTTCYITELFDQSGKGNNLTVEGKGGNGAADNAAIANALPVVAGGDRVYGLSVQAGVGYRNNATTGVPTGSEAQGIYMVTSGTHVDNFCCFDYGNAETNSLDNGNGHMEAINFGTECWFTCSGSGPWVEADLENGLFFGGNGVNATNTGNSSAFVTAMLKSDNTTTYALKGGDADSGSLTTWYSGALPTTSGYTPMSLEGAIVLGTGGDDSNSSDGSFFEGVMTSGEPSDAADNAVQANVTSVGYTTVAQTFPVTGTEYVVTNANNGKVMDDYDCSTANGAEVDTWAYLGNKCQRWAFTSVGNGRYTITNQASGHVLDSAGCHASNGTLADLWASLGNVCQEWNVTVDGATGGYTISNVGNGMVLDAKSCGTASGTIVRQWAQLDNPCQEWYITS